MGVTYQYFGIVAVTILAIGLAYIPRRWPLSRNHTFSQHIARKRSSVIYYVALFAIALPLLVAFFVGWFTPTFAAPAAINILIILAALFQLACTFVPETSGSKSAWHRTFAGLSGILLLPILVLLLAVEGVSIPAKIVTLAALLIMLWCTYVVIRANGRPHNFLIIQSVYFAVFFTPILLLSYTGI